MMFSAALREDAAIRFRSQQARWRATVFRSLRDGSHEVSLASDTNRRGDVWRKMPSARGDWQCMQERPIAERSILPVPKSTAFSPFAIYAEARN